MMRIEEDRHADIDNATRERMRRTQQGCGRIRRENILHEKE